MENIYFHICIGNIKIMKIDKKFREEYLDDFAYICTGLMKDRMQEVISPEVLEVLAKFEKLKKSKKKKK